MIKNINPAEVNRFERANACIAHAKAIFDHIIHIFNAGIAHLHTMTGFAHDCILQTIEDKACGVFINLDGLLSKVERNIVNCRNHILRALFP